MKKILIFTALFLACYSLAIAQKIKVDSLQKAYNKNRQDTTLIQLLQEKSGRVFLTTNADSGMLTARQSLALSRKIHYESGEARGLTLISSYLSRAGDLPGSLKLTFEALPKAIKIHDDRAIMGCYNSLGLTYTTLKDYQKALDNFYKFKTIAEKTHSNDLITVAYNNTGRAYIELNKLDSGYYYIKKSYDFSLKTKMLNNIGYPIRSFGIIEFKKGNFQKAIDFYNKSIKTIPGGNNHYLLSEDYRRMAEAYQRENKTDSCIYYGKLAFAQAGVGKLPELTMLATKLLANVFKSQNNFAEAYNYEQTMIAAQDSLFSQQKTLQIQNLNFEEEQRRDAIEAAKVSYQNRVRFYVMLGVIAVFVLIAGILLFANSQRKKANNVLHKTLSELKTTQTQLVQSEKMASLGELTAGIAHEIQNPLNFVNNFSEVNTELIDEMEQEISKGNLDEIKSLAADIKTNQIKISQHGKRADFIVKGMLQHSRSNTGEKQPTNLNILADEFLRLSFHGLRAKDKNFNAEMVTHFDPDLPKVNVVQQDMGRVILNLINNAFYAVNQKKKTAGDDYKPEVIVTTLSENGKVIIKVRDNGMGIPAHIRDKIMQPFFTTKPTGEGTGLGLSLSYDMVVHGHGGKIELNTKEGEFTEFTVTLPN